MEAIAHDYGDHVLREAAKSPSYASMQLAMFRREQEERLRRCPAQCPGCAELARVVAALEPLAAT